VTLRYGRGRPRHAALAAACSFCLGGSHPWPGHRAGAFLGGRVWARLVLGFRGRVGGNTRKQRSKHGPNVVWLSPQTSSGVGWLVRCTHHHPLACHSSVTQRRRLVVQNFNPPFRAWRITHAAHWSFMERGMSIYVGPQLICPSYPRIKCVAASPADYVSLVLLAPRNLLPLKNVQCAGAGGQALFFWQERPMNGAS
jgi:hypothetical protein